MTLAAQSPSAIDSKRWFAHFSGNFVAVDGHTRMGRTNHYGPLRVQRPFFPEGLDYLHLYLLHPPGGLVGGDRLSIDISLESRAKVLMTTPSAGKIYRNISGLKQGQHVNLKVADGAVMEYLPQENIVFDGAEAELNTQVDIEGSGLFIGWELTCLGRFESGELFEAGQLQQSLIITHDGRPLFNDRLNLYVPSDHTKVDDTNAGAGLIQNAQGLQASNAGFQNRSVFGTFVINAELLHADSESDASGLTERLLDFQARFNDEQAGASRLAMTQKPGVFIARALGDKAERLRQCFEQIWTMARPTLLTRTACVPRIWRT